MKRKFRNLEKAIHQIKLQQLGAQVEVIKGIMHFVKVPIEDTVIKYVYHINNKGDYFLQRRSPYPINFGTYESQEDLINIIERDIAQMKNAKKSKKFDRFVQINKTLSQLAINFEDLYLDYNISSTQTQKFHEKIEEINDLINETKNNSKKIHLEEK